MTVAERANTNVVENGEIQAEEKRKALRQAIIDSSKPESLHVEFFGQDVELRQPSLETILAAQEDAAEDRVATIIRMIITYAFVPGTDLRVFDEHDYDIIAGMPFGADLSRMNEAVTKLTNIDVLGEEKNFESAQQE